MLLRWLCFFFILFPSELWVLVKSWHFCFQLLFSCFGFSCSTFVSSILVFVVGILFDIFVFNYYSPILVFLVQLLFRRFWFLLWGFCFINACCVWREMLFVFGVLVLAFDVLFRACTVCFAGIVVPICIWYLTEGWWWWVECFLIYLCMFSCFLFVIQVVPEAAFCPFKVDV